MRYDRDERILRTLALALGLGILLTALLSLLACSNQRTAGGPAAPDVPDLTQTVGTSAQVPTFGAAVFDPLVRHKVLWSQEGNDLTASLARYHFLVS